MTAHMNRRAGRDAPLRRPPAAAGRGSGGAGRGGPGCGVAGCRRRQKLPGLAWPAGAGGLAGVIGSA